MKRADKILVIGAMGDTGRKITELLRYKYGKTQVIATDLLKPARVKSDNQPYFRLDVFNKARLLMLVRDEGVTQIYLMATMFSADEEQNPQMSWNLNMDGLLNVLDISVKCNIEKVVWPSCQAHFS